MAFKPSRSSLYHIVPLEYDTNPLLSVKNSKEYPPMKTSSLYYAPLLSFIFLLGGCSLSRLAEVGEVPELSPITNPTADKEYRHVSLPMPAPSAVTRQANSLWRPGSRGFFKDLRANNIGDIVTVLIRVSDSAELSSATSRTRTNSEDSQIGALAGFDNVLESVLPGAPDLNNLLDVDSALTSTGNGNITRNEAIDMRVAAVITQILPNGALALYGRQEVRVNHEIRELHVAGIIRPQDISNQNQILFEKIAEARVAYGGRGIISNTQRPRYGSEIADVLLPF